MNIQDYPLKAGQWFPEPTSKRYVVWHGTGGRTRNTPSGGKPGRASTSIDSWNEDEFHVGAPYLVDRDGTVYRTFDDSGWIYHLGIKGTNGKYDRAAVGIEFANELDLTLDGDKLHAFGHLTPSTEYKGKYFSAEWRGSSYFAEMDEAQVEAGIDLTLDICHRYSIEPLFYYPSLAFDFPRCFQMATILCHSNCRKDKTDLYLPDWIWNKIRAAGIKVVG